MSVPRPPALVVLPWWRLRTRVVVALASGAGLTLAFAPVDLRAIAFVALAPLLLAVRGASIRDGAVAGAAFGLAFFGVLVAWVSLVGWLAWGVLVASQTLFLAAFGAGAAALSRGRVPGRLIGIPLLYTGIEMLRARHPLGGFAWGLLGSSQHSGLPLLPLARAGGVFAVTLALAAIGALCAEAIAARRRMARVLVLGLAACIAAVPAWMPLGAVQPAGTLDVAIVQGSVPRGHFQGLRRGRVGPEDEVIIENHLRLTQTLAGDPPDVVVWPENALDRDPFLDQTARDGVDGALRATGAPLLVGAILEGPRRNTFYNANLLFAPDGTVLGRYDKVHLVPFGEYVPWGWARRLIPALDQVPTDGLAGRGPVVMELPSGARIGSVICFENSYPALVRTLARRGSDMIVVATNTATFDRSPLARQHLALSRMRAVETGRPVVHAGISGISALISPGGTIIQRAGLFVPAVLRQTMALAGGQTGYVAYGHLFETALASGAGLAALAAIALALLRRRGIETDEDEEAFWVAGRRNGGTLGDEPAPVDRAPAPASVAPASPPAEQPP